MWLDTYKKDVGKILVRSRNLESIFDQSRSLVFAWFVFTFFESRNFLPKSLGLRFLTRIWDIWASRQVSDQVYHSPPLYLWVCIREKETKGSLLNDWLLRVLNRTKIRIAKALKKYFYCNRYCRCRHMCSRMVSFPVLQCLYLFRFPTLEPLWLWFFPSICRDGEITKNAWSLLSKQFIYNC